MDDLAPTTVLDREDCLNRLSAAPLARILVSVKCLPTALPARVRVLNRDRILIASSDSTILLAAQRHDVLTVQVDGVDESNHPWSVVASGIAEVSPDIVPAEDPWSGGAGPGGPLVSFPVSVVVGQRH
ncbi:MAG: pyridoxamine 5'-phosphate oxidase family protein [Acidobacteria bacterium]|nr:pyridoxamine 5'-phosphate oxidase family protein [Acidobacteriota bacterium]